MPPLLCLWCCNAGQGQLSPAEILIRLVGLDGTRDKVPRRRMMQALEECLAMRDVFTQEAMVVALQQLVTRCEVSHVCSGQVHM